MSEEYDFSKAKRAKDVPHLAKLQVESQGKSHETFFGMFSPSQRNVLIDLLSPLNVRFRFLPEITSEEMLREWCAWDESSAKSNKAFNLLINSEDLALVGTKVVDLYPERKFGAY